MDVYPTTTSTSAAVDAADVLDAIDSDNLSVVVYFTIGFTGLLQLPLIVDAIDSMLPNTIGRTTHSAVSYLLIVGIITVYLGCLTLNISKVLPFWRDEYHMSQTTFVVHVVVTVLLVANSLSQYALAAILVPAKTSRTQSIRTKPHKQQASGSVNEVDASSSRVERIPTTADKQRDSSYVSETNTTSNRVESIPTKADKQQGSGSVSETNTSGEEGESAIGSTDQFAGVGGHATVPGKPMAAPINGNEVSEREATNQSGGVAVNTRVNQQDIDKPTAQEKAKPGVFCKTCGVERTRWQNHCHTCGCCSALMDHHCPFLNGCVWEGNYRHFLLFLLHSVNAVVYSFYVTYPVFYTCFLANPSDKSAPCQALGPAMSFIAIPLTMLGGLVIVLFLFEVFLLYIGMSTYDFLKKFNKEGPCFAWSALRKGRSSDRAQQTPDRYQILVGNPIASAGIVASLLPIHSLRLLWRIFRERNSSQLLRTSHEKVT